VAFPAGREREREKGEIYREKEREKERRQMLVQARMEEEDAWIDPAAVEPSSRAMQLPAKREYKEEGKKEIEEAKKRKTMNALTESNEWEDEIIRLPQ
jgi:hypothetical protein